jgi:DNA-binding XRE family transcriptional regulator
MSLMKVDSERVVQLAKMEEMVLAILLDRIAKLPKEGQEDLAELMDLFSKSTTKKEREEILESMKELLQPSLIGELVQGPMPKSGTKDLENRAAYLGQKIKELRAKKSMTQEDLAELSGIPQSYISRLEAGQHSPSHATLEKIAQALGVDVHQIDYE